MSKLVVMPTDAVQVITARDVRRNPEAAKRRSTIGNTAIAPRIGLAISGAMHGYLTTDPFSNSVQWIFAGIGASMGGMGAVVSGQSKSSGGRFSIIEINLAAAQ